MFYNGFLARNPYFGGGSGAPFWGLLGAIFWQFLENLEILLFEPFFWFCDPFFLHSLCVSVSVPVSASVCVCVWDLVQDDPHGIYGKHMRPCKRGGGYLRARQVGGDAGAQHWIIFSGLLFTFWRHGPFSGPPGALGPFSDPPGGWLTSFCASSGCLVPFLY